MNFMRLFARALASIALLVSTPAISADGVRGVVVYDKGCGSRLIIETALGYVLAEWYGGNSPSKGDVIVGEINGYGLKAVYNLTAKAGSRLWIDDYMLSRGRVLEKLHDKCN